MRKLIVNKDGHLSALPTVEEATVNAFAVSPDRFFCYEVSINENDLANIWINRDRTIVLSPDCPLKQAGDIVDPNWYYVRVMPGTPLQLVPVVVPQGVPLAYAQAMATARINQQFHQAKQGRFSSSATGTERYYDGSDFLLFAMAFVQRGQTAPFSCSTSQAGPWLPVDHTPGQINTVGGDYSAWYNALQVRFYQAQAAIEAAQSAGTADSIIF